MNLSEQDLRDALNELDRRAVEHGAPTTASILDSTAVRPLDHSRDNSERRFPGRLAPLAAAAVVAAAGVTVAVLASGNGGTSRHLAPHAGGSQRPTRSTASHPTSTPSISTPPRSKIAPPPLEPPSSGAPTSSSTSTSSSGTKSVAIGVLAAAANKLDTSPPSYVPQQNEYYYRKTTDSISWTSVSGRKPGKGHNFEGVPAGIPGCRHGHFVGGGTSGACTLNDVSHYLADAPTTPSAWDAYLEHIAPGAKAADAQGKIIVQVLHEDLTSPPATAALLRYTESCPGLHVVKTGSVAGEQLTGVTCTSMSDGSYGLAFDGSTHAFVGFVPVDYQTGKQDRQAEIVLRTGIVKALGDKP